MCVYIIKIDSKNMLPCSRWCGGVFSPKNEFAQL